MVRCLNLLDWAEPRNEVGGDGCREDLVDGRSVGSGFQMIGGNGRCGGVHEGSLRLSHSWAGLLNLLCLSSHEVFSCHRMHIQFSHLVGPPRPVGVAKDSREQLPHLWVVAENRRDLLVLEQRYNTGIHDAGAAWTDLRYIAELGHNHLRRHVLVRHFGLRLQAGGCFLRLLGLLCCLLSSTLSYLSLHTFLHRNPTPMVVPIA